MDRLRHDSKPQISEGQKVKLLQTTPDESQDEFVREEAKETQQQCSASKTRLKQKQSSGTKSKKRNNKQTRQGKRVGRVREKE